MDKNTYTIALFALCLFAFAICCFPISNTVNVANAYSIESLLSDDVIAFYEKEIAEENFISGMSKFRVERMCDTYSVNGKKLSLMLIMQDLGARTGESVSLEELSDMSDRQLVSRGKKLVKAYIATLSEAQKEQLKQDWKQRER